MVLQNVEEDVRSTTFYVTMYANTIKNPNYTVPRNETIETQVVQAFIVHDLVDATKDMEDDDRNYYGMDVEVEELKTHLNNKDDYLEHSIRKIVKDIEKTNEDHEDIGMDKVVDVVVNSKVVDDPDIQITMQVEIVKIVETTMNDEIEAPNQKDEVKNYL